MAEEWGHWEKNDSGEPRWVKLPKISLTQAGYEAPCKVVRPDGVEIDVIIREVDHGETNS